MAYLYETHLHTRESSSCAKSFGREYVRRYLELGYQGIIVTDHFFHGNTAISRRLPWREWVNRFYSGFEETWNEGEKLGLDVFFGWEENFDGDEYLIYGLDKQWLLKHPEVVRWTRKEQFDTVNRYGGCVVQAHPFRQREYISTVHLSAGCVHGVEVANMGNKPDYDVLAFSYARLLGLTMTAGTDIHETHQFGDSSMLGVYTENKLNSISDYVSAVRENKIIGRQIPEGRCDCIGNEKIILPICLHDEGDGESWHNKKTLFELLRSKKT